MTREELIQQVNRVIVILKDELDGRTKGKGVYKHLLSVYEEAYEDLNANKEYIEIGIGGGLRYFADASKEDNKALVSELSRAERMLRDLQGW